MRREELYLTDIVEAADAIGRFLEGITCDDFMSDELRQSAVETGCRHYPSDQESSRLALQTVFLRGYAIQPRSL